MVNSLFNRLTPKEPKFFPVLKKISGIAISASDLLIEYLHSDRSQVELNYYKKIKELERAADGLSHRIFEDLNSTFITPFDREDIHNLANNLDDVIDGINKCAKNVALYNPKQIPESAIKLAELIKEAALQIGIATDELDVLKKSSKKIKKCCRELHEIENRADEVCDNFIKNLFSEEKDSIELIKLTDIIYELERTTDVAEHVGKIIRTIIVKYA
jgi:predicted phosphate transport protein (TIGR00153 family)